MFNSQRTGFASEKWPFNIVAEQRVKKKEIRKCIMNFSGKQKSKPLVLFKLNGDTAPNAPFIKKG